MRIGPFNYTIERAIRDDGIRDIDLTDPQEHTASIATGRSYARADLSAGICALRV